MLKNQKVSYLRFGGCRERLNAGMTNSVLGWQIQSSANWQNEGRKNILQLNEQPFLSLKEVIKNHSMQLTWLFDLPGYAKHFSCVLLHSGLSRGHRHLPYFWPRTTSGDLHTKCSLLHDGSIVVRISALVTSIVVEISMLEGPIVVGISVLECPIVVGIAVLECPIVVGASVLECPIVVGASVLIGPIVVRASVVFGPIVVGTLVVISPVVVGALVVVVTSLCKSHNSYSPENIIIQIKNKKLIFW